MLRVGTDCSGIEAPIQALKRLRISFRHLFSSDINPSVIQSIKANYHPEIIFGDPDGPYPDGDITKRKTSLLPQLDLYVCGFPCQPFSHAGKREGLNDSRGNVFFTCVDVIKHCKPKYFILENVKGLLTHDGGNTWNVIENKLKTLKDYTIQHKILNTKDFGIPQNRERIFIIGTKSRKGFEWPKPRPMQSILDFVDRSDKTKQVPSESTRLYLDETPKNAVFVDTGFSADKIKHGRVVKYAHLYMSTLMTGSPVWCIPMKRPANVKEYMMLQGFPTNFKQVVSDTQMKKQLGNSISVNVLVAIFKNLID